MPAEVSKPQWLTRFANAAIELRPHLTFKVAMASANIEFAGAKDVEPEVAARRWNAKQAVAKKGK